MIFFLKFFKPPTLDEFARLVKGFWVKLAVDVVTLDFTDELAIIIGDDFVYTIEFQDEFCEPIDQTGNTFTAEITKNGTLIETFTTAISTESVIISLTDTETAALTPMKNGVRWKLRQTVGSVTTTILTGDVEIEAV